MRDEREADADVRLSPCRLVRLHEQELLLRLEEGGKRGGHVRRLVLQRVLSCLYLRDHVGHLGADVALRAQQVGKFAEARVEPVEGCVLAIKVGLPSIAVGLQLREVRFEP